MRGARYVCLTLAALFLVAAVTSSVVLFDGIETTTGVLAGASTAFSFLALELLRRERGTAGEARSRR